MRTPWYIPGKGRTAERKVERMGRKEDMGIREEIKRGKGRGVSERMLGGKVQRGKSINRMGKRKRDFSRREGLRGWKWRKRVEKRRTG